MAAETTGAAGPGLGGRMSRRRKRDAVLRLLRGENLETVPRALGVTAATLSGWCDTFLAAGEASLASRPTDGEALESERLKARLGEMLLREELLHLDRLCGAEDRSAEGEQRLLHARISQSARHPHDDISSSGRPPRPIRQSTRAYGPG